MVSSTTEKDWVLMVVDFYYFYYVSYLKKKKKLDLRKFFVFDEAMGGIIDCEDES